jgi:hypothetical protein
MGKVGIVPGRIGVGLGVDLWAVRGLCGRMVEAPMLSDAVSPHGWRFSPERGLGFQSYTQSYSQVCRIRGLAWGGGVEGP